MHVHKLHAESERGDMPASHPADTVYIGARRTNDDTSARFAESAVVDLVTRMLLKSFPSRLMPRAKAELGEGPRARHPQTRGNENHIVHSIEGHPAARQRGRQSQRTQRPRIAKSVASPTNRPAEQNVSAE